MSDLLKAVELTVDLRRAFAAMADCFDAEYAERTLLSHILTTSIEPAQARSLVAALREDYEHVKAEA